jgi:hypothetical protein
VRQTGSVIQYFTFVPVFGFDTVRVTAYKLPLTVGATWNMFTYLGDTTTSVRMGALPVRLKFAYDWQGTGRDSTTAAHTFDRSRPTHIVASGTTMHVSAVSETTIVIGTTTLFSVGDTILTWTVDNYSQQGVSPDLGIGLWTSQREYKRELNHVNQVAVNDTTRTSSMVTTYYDPRTGTTLAR